MQYFNLPDPGEGLVEAELVTWRVAVGDEVAVNDVVVEIETSKSLVELPSPYSGRVAQLLVEEGTTVDVGTPIIAIDDGSEDAAEEDSAAAAPNLVGYGVKAAGTSRRPRRAAGAANGSGAGDAAGTSAAATAGPPADRPVGASGGSTPAAGSARHVQSQLNDSFDPAQPVARPAGGVAPLEPTPAQPAGDPLPSPGRGPSEPDVERGPVLAKPPTRLLAKQLGVDLRRLAGTGDGGIITRADVESAAAAAAAAGPGAGDRPDVGGSDPAAVRPEDDERIPVRGVRKITAEAMVTSAFTAPHVTEWIEVDVTASMELLERLRSRRDLAGVRLTPLVLVAAAVCRALERTPELNSRWVDVEGGAEIVRSREVNLGIAAATPRGLMVPNIKGAQRLRLRELADALTELVSVAKEGRTQPAALSGGTFTVTNVGVFGIDGGTPIINPGQAGILCLGAINRRPWVVGEGAEERIEPRWVTTLSVSFDHRVADGAEGSRFLADVALSLTDPAMGALL